FAKQSEHRFGPGMPAFVEVARGPVKLFLSEHRGDARPDTLVYLRVPDVDAVAAEFGATVAEQPWGARSSCATPTATGSGSGRRRGPAHDRRPPQLPIARSPPQPVVPA